MEKTHEDDVKRAVRVLNEINKADPSVLPKLINYRVPCNEAVADHPTVQVGTYHEASKETGYSVGLLGIINGLLGIDDNQWGFIGAIISERDGDEVIKIEEFVDNREWEKHDRT